MEDSTPKRRQTTNIDLDSLVGWNQRGTPPGSILWSLLGQYKERGADTSRLDPSVVHTPAMGHNLRG